MSPRRTARFSYEENDSYFQNKFSKWVKKGTIPEIFNSKARKPVRLSTFDRSNGITFVGDANKNVVKGLKGYRTIRATCGVSEGDWYFECEMMPFEIGNARLGWSMRRSIIDTPVGCDAYGFSFRDLTGDFVHRARPRKYGDTFGSGDVIGCRIVLPELSAEQKRKIQKAEDLWLEYRYVFHRLGQVPDDSGIDLFPHGSVEFFKNGKSMGMPESFSKPQIPASEGELDVQRFMTGGVYYPSVALYNEAVVKANFGPHFKYPIPQGSKPMCDVP